MTTTQNQEAASSSTTREPVAFYGWVVVAACFAGMFCVGEVTWSFGVFFPSIEDEFGWSRGLISGGYTLLVMGHGVSAILGGRLADRGAARPVLVGSALLGGLAITLCSQMHSASQFYALFLATGLATGANHSIPTSTVQRWFANKRHAGIALAAVTAGIGIGSLVFAPLYGQLIGSIGWRPTMMVAGVTFGVVAGVAGLLNRPHDSQRQPATGSQPGIGESRRQTTTDTRRILFARQFLILVGITCIALVSFQVMVIHLVPYARDVGLSPGVAALAVGIIGGASIPGRFLCGAISDRVGWGRALAIALIVGAAGMAGLTVASESWVLMCVVVLFGIGHGMRAVAVIGLMGRCFGTVVLGELLGIMIAVGQLMSAPAPYIAGYWHDLTNSYGIMFALIAATLTAGAIVVLQTGRQLDPQT